MPSSSQIPIFLINLDRSLERLASFETQMERLGLSFERVTAVDADDIPEEEVQRLESNQSRQFPWGKGVMGCFLSHRKVWNIISERGLEWSFIAEDDLHIAKADPFFTADDWIPHNADVVKAETFRQRVFMSESLPWEIDGHKLHQLESSHIGAGGYFLSTAGARFLLNATENVSDPVDHLIFDPSLGIFPYLTVYQIDPAICVQDGMLYDIRQKVGFVSTLQAERVGLLEKPHGWAKIWREVSRPFKRLGKRISDCWALISARWKRFRHGTVVKFVPYVDDS